MDSKPSPFVPAAPTPRKGPPSTLQMIRIAYVNPLELWQEPSFNERWTSRPGMGGRPVVIANDPGLIRHVLVDNAKNYCMSVIRQKMLLPMLRDGLLTAEGEMWKRSRKSMAPVFTPRHIFGFAGPMLERARIFATRYKDGGTVDFSDDMTNLTYDILAETLFSGEIAGDPVGFERQAARLFETMGRVDPLDFVRAPDWLPRFTRIRGRKTLAYFRQVVADTMEMRRKRMARDPDGVPEDFLTLLLRAEGPEGLSAEEIKDNIITFIFAGHETTARSLGWTIYCLAEAPWEREKVEAEIDHVVATVDGAALGQHVGGADHEPPPDGAGLGDGDHDRLRAVDDDVVLGWAPVVGVTRVAVVDEAAEAGEPVERERAGRGIGLDINEPVGQAELAVRTNRVSGHDR